MANNFNTDGLIPVEEIFNSKDYRRAPRKKDSTDKKSDLEPML